MSDRLFVKPDAASIRNAVSGFVVIVVGVLVALWAEGAWAERGERARERVILVDLLEEFATNDSTLSRDILLGQNSRAASLAWAAAMRGESRVSPDSLTQLWLQSLNWGRYDPITGVLRSVIDGGELGLIRNDELRHALAGWEDRAEEARISSREILIVMSDQIPFVLGIEPGGPFTPGELSAIETVDAWGGGPLIQLVPLLDELREITALLKTELEG